MEAPSQETSSVVPQTWILDPLTEASFENSSVVALASQLAASLGSGFVDNSLESLVAAFVGPPDSSLTEPSSVSVRCEELSVAPDVPSAEPAVGPAGASPVESSLDSQVAAAQTILEAQATTEASGYQADPQIALEVATEAAPPAECTEEAPSAPVVLEALLGALVKAEEEVKTESSDTFAGLEKTEPETPAPETTSLITDFLPVDPTSSRDASATEVPLAEEPSQTTAESSSGTFDALFTAEHTSSSTSLPGSTAISEQTPLDLVEPATSQQVSQEAQTAGNDLSDLLSFGSPSSSSTTTSSEGVSATPAPSDSHDSFRFHILSAPFEPPNPEEPRPAQAHAEESPALTQPVPSQEPASKEEEDAERELQNMLREAAEAEEAAQRALKELEEASD